jgi:hypothetical protein
LARRLKEQRQTLDKLFNEVDTALYQKDFDESLAEARKEHLEQDTKAQEVESSLNQKSAGDKVRLENIRGEWKLYSSAWLEGNS